MRTRQVANPAASNLYAQSLNANRRHGGDLTASSRTKSDHLSQTRAPCMQHRQTNKGCIDLRAICFLQNTHTVACLGACEILYESFPTQGTRDINCQIRDPDRTCERSLSKFSR